ncbi:MAG: DUF1559 domain-containing protein [bacterium]|nr:DUF1559 domain-containing protein [bacterium]
MLLPALSQARERARAAKCISNLKQIGVAYLMYCDDYDGWGPRIKDTDPVAGYHWGWFLVNYQYLSNRECLLCPSVAGRRKFINYSETYGYLLDWGEGHPLGYPCVKRMSKTPSNAGIIFDSAKNSLTGIMNAFVYSYYNSSDLCLVAKRHNGIANALFLDGHVEGCNSTRLRTLEKQVTASW